MCFSEIQRRELEDLARKGEDSPTTQIKKAIGVFSNAETALQEGAKRVAEDPKMRELYLDGRELSRAKRRTDDRERATVSRVLQRTAKDI